MGKRVSPGLNRANTRFRHTPFCGHIPQRPAITAHPPAPLPKLCIRLERGRDEISISPLMLSLSARQQDGGQAVLFVMRACRSVERVEKTNLE